MAIFMKMDVKAMKLETGQLMSEGAHNSFHSCCFDSDLDNTAASKQSKLQLWSSGWWFHSFFIGEIFWTWIWSLLTFFWAAICKSKKAHEEGKFCVSPFDILHIMKFTWFQLFPFCTEQSIHTVLLSHVQLCSHCGRIMHTVGHIVDTLWRAQRGSFCSVSLTFDDD